MIIISIGGFDDIVRGGSVGVVSGGCAVDKEFMLREMCGKYIGERIDLTSWRNHIIKLIEMWQVFQIRGVNEGLIVSSQKFLQGTRRSCVQRNV